MERKRLLWAALGLLLVVTALVVRRRVSAPAARTPQPVLFSADASARISSALRRFAALLGRGAARPVTVADVRAVLSSAADDPLARRFAEEFLREPALKAAWERHRDDDPADTLVAEVVDTPQFTELVDQWQKNPDFAAVAERLADELEVQAAEASASSDRMLLGAVKTPATAAPAVAARAPQPQQAARSIGYADELLRFRSIFSLMEPEPRKRVLAQLEQGLPVREACARANAAQACDESLKRCQTDEDCARWLARNEGLGPGAGKERIIVHSHEDEDPGPEKGQEARPAENEPPEPRRSGPSGDGGAARPSPTSRPTPNPFDGLGGKSRKGPSVDKPKVSPPPDDCYRPNCFAAGTRVLTPAGEVPIEAIRPGDAVLTADLEGGMILAATVVRTFQSTAKGLRRVTFSNGLELRVTGEHPVFDPQTGAFRRVRELRAGDRAGLLDRRSALLPAGAPEAGLRPPPQSSLGFSQPAARLLETLTIIGIQELADEGVPVYNFHVGERQNYFAEGVLVHNRKVCAN